MTRTMLTLVLIATPAWAGLPEGRTAWKAGDYTRAITEIRAPAEAGNADAQMMLGEAYRMGRGVVPDPATALSWYRRASAQGNTAARDALGLMLFQQGQRREAIPLLEKAADGGDPRALYLLGTAHFNGDYAAKDWPLAYALMSRAATAGLPQAKTSLATMDRYLFPADKAKAQALLAAQAAAPAPTKPPPVVAKAPVPAGTKAASTPVLKPAAPKSAATADAPAKPAKGAWRVQLGAYGSADRARTAWTALAAKVPALGKLDQRIVASGSVQRLQAGGIASHDAADTLCKAVTAAGNGCFPIAP